MNPPEPEGDYYVLEPCATANAFEIKLNGKKLDLQKCEQAFSELGEVAATTPVVILAKIDGYEISAYASGRLMIKSEKKMKFSLVKSFAKKLVSSLTNERAIY
ncbi:hypothetical protein HY988_02095 [Candidatus Micrarchaeota archaeon]|nr:hypothetical protein [Candidatus Micrarchaeota archaeon]